MTFDAWSLPHDLETPDIGTLDGTEGHRIAALDPAAGWLGTVVDHLASGRRRLLARPALELAETLGRAAARFLDPTDPLRLQALEHLPGTSGLSGEMSAAVLDGMAADWTPERLRQLVIAEFGDPPALDGFVPGHRGGVRASGAALTTQIVAGSVPGVGGTALLRSLLVKSPTLLKPGRGDVVLPVLLARAIRDEDPDLSATFAVVYWPGGRDDLTAIAAEGAGVVVAYGGDDAVGAVRRQTPVTSRFVGYHHRVSVGVVGREGLSGDLVTETASEVAGSVAFFDQRGCVSPQVVYVERGGEADPVEFASRVAEALGVIESHLPGGALEADEASAVHQARGTAELLAASGRGVRVHHGGDASWTVILDPTAEMTTVCAGRTVRLVPVDRAQDVPALLRPLARHVQTVAVTGCGADLEDLAGALAEVGVTRVAYFDQAPFPPPWWHHDGVGPLRALVEWTDLETG
jgi:hypothetical protein